MSATSVADEVLAFPVEKDTDVHLTCPWCYASIWLVADGEIETLGDVIKAAQAHDCDEDEDGAA